MSNKQNELEILYRKYSGYLMGLCMRYSSTRDEAEDTLHDAFIKIYDNIDKLDKNDNVKSYLYGLVKNHIIYKFRRTKLKFDLHADISDVLRTQAADDDFVPDDFDTNVYSILKAMQGLTDKERLIFNMHYIDGYILNEISQILEIPVNTAKVISWRAKNKIKEDLRIKKLVTV